jgi:hypothetical protein
MRNCEEPAATRLGDRFQFLQQTPLSFFPSSEQNPGLTLMSDLVVFDSRAVHCIAVRIGSSGRQKEYDCRQAERRHDEYKFHVCSSVIGTDAAGQPTVRGSSSMRNITACGQYK